MEQDEQLLKQIVQAMVNYPEGVRTTRTVDEMGVLITLDVDSRDMGYVIGRQGRTAQALRTILKTIGSKNSARVNLKINEPAGGRGFGAGSSAQPTSEPVDTSAVDDLGI